MINLLMENTNEKLNLTNTNNVTSHILSPMH